MSWLSLSQCDNFDAHKLQMQRLCHKLWLQMTPIWVSNVVSSPVAVRCVLPLKLSEANQILVPFESEDLMKVNATKIVSEMLDHHLSVAMELSWQFH